MIFAFRDNEKTVLVEGKSLPKVAKKMKILAKFLQKQKFKQFSQKVSK
jgi:hypothetical protein